MPKRSGGGLHDGVDTEGFVAERIAAAFSLTSNLVAMA